MLWALPREARGGRPLLRQPVPRMTWHWLSAGRNATVLHGVAIWGWHAPLLFDAAVTNIMLHRLQHLSFLVTAVLFWWSVLWRSDPGVAAWHLFITMMHTGVLGALMALAPRVLYAAADRDRRRLGVDAAGRPAAGRPPHVGAGGNGLCGRRAGDDGAVDQAARAKARADDAVSAF